MSIPKPDPLALRSDVGKPRRRSKRLEFIGRCEVTNVLKLLRAVKSRYPNVTRVVHKFTIGAERLGNICDIKVNGNIAYICARAKYRGL